MPPDDHTLMTLHADILFSYDSRGRMLRTNEPDGRPAPRFFLGRTLGGHVLRFGATMPDDVARQLTEIVESLPPVDDLTVPPTALATIRETLERYAPINREGAGPGFRFPEVLNRPDNVVQVTDVNVDLVRDTFPWLVGALADWWPCFAVVRDDAAVSVCFSSRIGVEATEAGVNTLPAFRGHGYAVAVTRAWGAAIRESGRIPLYSTSWENHASRGVARRAGLLIYGADTSWA